MLESVCIRILKLSQVPASGTMTQLDLVEVDATGLACPMPLLKAKRALNAMQVGQRLRVLATDQGSVRDFRVFAEQSGHLLLDSAETGWGIQLPDRKEIVQVQTIVTHIIIVLNIIINGDTTHAAH